MSVLTCFGENLRSLAKAQGTLTSAANSLGFSKVQFQRFLNGTSFPKPHHLERICNYFDVDARILLQPLTDELLLSMRHDRPGGPHLANPSMGEAINFACPTQDFFSEKGGLGDGFYAVYRHSMSTPGRYVRILLYVQTLDKARVVRGYDTKFIYPDGTPSPVREFKGIVHRTIDGFSFLFYHNPPTQLLSLMHITPIVSVMGVSAYVGFVCLGRNSMPNKTRFSEVYVEKIPNGVAGALKFQRMETFIDRKALPLSAQSLASMPTS